MGQSNKLIAAGIVQLLIALVLSLALPLNLPAAASHSALGVTPTFTPRPTDTDTPITPTDTPSPSPPTDTPTPTKRSEEGKTPVPGGPKLSIVKTASATNVTPGSQVTFKIQVCNDGDAVAENVVVSDALPPELELVSASASQGTVATEGNNVRVELGAIQAGSCADVTIVARVRADVAPGTQIRNVGSVDGLYDDVILSVSGLLPASGERAPWPLIGMLLAVGVGFIVAGALLKGHEATAHQK